MEAKKFFEIWNENNLLSSGETEQLDNMQRDFYLVFEKQDESLKIDSEWDGFWVYRKVYNIEYDIELERCEFSENQQIDTFVDDAEVKSIKIHLSFSANGTVHSHQNLLFHPEAPLISSHHIL